MKIKTKFLRIAWSRLSTRMLICFLNNKIEWAWDLTETWININNFKIQTITQMLEWIKISSKCWCNSIIWMLELERMEVNNSINFIKLELILLMEEFYKANITKWCNKITRGWCLLCQVRTSKVETHILSKLGLSTAVL